MTLNFFDTVNNSNHRFFALCERYLHLDELSSKFGYAEFKILDVTRPQLIQQQSTNHVLRKTQRALTAIKIVSYVILFPLPLIALIGKTIHRNLHHFKIMPPHISSPSPLELDISNKQWLDQYHLWLYCKFLQTKYLGLHVPKLPTVYTVENIHTFLLEDLKAPSTTTIFAYPLCISKNHWTLLLIDTNKLTIEYYDSLGDDGDFTKVCDMLEQTPILLSDMRPAKIYQMQYKIHKPLQQDGYQCGVWVLKFLHERLKNPQIDFNTLDITLSQSMIQEFRQEVMQQLIQTEQRLSRHSIERVRSTVSQRLHSKFADHAIEID